MPPLTPAEREQRNTAILAAHAEGKTRNDIAREVGCAAAIVSDVVKKAGKSFDRTAVAAATEARKVDLASRRATALERELEILETLQAHVIDVFAGKRKHQRIIRDQKGADFAESFDFIPAQDVQQLANARSSSTTVITRLTDNDTGVDAAKSVLVGLAQALGVTGPEQEPTHDA